MVKFSKFVVVLVITLNIVFAGVVLWIFYRTKTEPVALIGAWFSFTTVELWALAGIKKKEVEGENNVKGDKEFLGKD